MLLTGGFGNIGSHTCVALLKSSTYSCYCRNLYNSKVKTKYNRLQMMEVEEIFENGS